MQKMQNPSMFGIDMLPKETQSIFSKRRLVPGKLVIVSVDMYGKIAITGEWMYSIAWKHVLSFMFFLYLFICFTVQKSFLQFFIFLSYISLFNFFFLFFIFRIITMFLPVNVQKFVNSLLTFTVNKTFGSSHSRDFLIIGVHIRYTSGIPLWGSSPVKLQF